MFNLKHHETVILLDDLKVSALHVTIPGNFILPLPERPTFMADVASENGYRHSGCMRYFLHVQRYPQ